MNEPKKRGRPAKTADQSGEDAGAEVQDGQDLTQHQTQDEAPDVVAVETPVNQELTPEQVQAWIRANREKMPPLPEKVQKRKRKMLRM